jgi:prepilin-type N-terminal cleavage/methylation domain-containing protein
MGQITKFCFNRIIKGFTLIEVMIAVALIAILFGGGIRVGESVHWLTREINCGDALRQANSLKNHIARIPFDSLPPEVLTVPPNGVINLKNHPVLQNSVNISLIGKNSAVPFKVDCEKGKVTIGSPGYSGKQVIINYAFTLPETGEGGTIPNTPPYRLQLSNAPIKSITSVSLLTQNGEEVLDKKSYFREPDGKGIYFAKKYAGKTVRVIYFGDNVKTNCSGGFIDDVMSYSAVPTAMKLVKITASYGTRNDLEIVDLRVKK